MDGIVVFLFEEFHLERKNGKEFVDIALDILDAVFLPRPNLWGDIIVDSGRREEGGGRSVAQAVNVLGNIKIEAWIIDKDDDIRLPLRNILLAHLHILENGTQMQQDRNEPHIRQFAIVTNTRTTDCSHQVTSEETKLCCFVALLQCLHQVRRMQVATGLASYQVILHSLRGEG